MAGLVFWKRLLAGKTADRPPAPAADLAVPKHYRYFPVFIPAADTVVSFSPKSGCSHIVLWSFLHQGLYEAANAYDPWPHKYRLKVYHHDAAFQAPLQRLLASGGSGHTLLKVTRDPKRRLVSIFRHACRFAFLQKQVQAALGFDMRKRGLSLADFDTVLGRMKLVTPTPADPHVRAQSHPLWHMGFDRVITLNMDEIPLNASLNAVERALGMPETDFAGLPAFGNLRETHYARDGGFAIDGPIETYRFRPPETLAFPKAQLMASPLLERMARRHYRMDYAGTGSGDTAGRLFQAGNRRVAT
jgi:hypothetical protein